MVSSKVWDNVIFPLFGCWGFSFAVHGEYSQTDCFLSIYCVEKIFSYAIF
jgi:hypothetical protein